MKAPTRLLSGLIPKSQLQKYEQSYKEVHQPN